MFRTLPLAAAALILAGSPAFAANPVIWSGRLQVVSKTKPCNAKGNPHQVGFPPFDTEQSQYRPHLKTGDNRSAFTLNAGEDQHIFVTASPTGQFNGSGSYTTQGVDGIVEPTPPQTGTFTMTQSPATVLASTKFITLTGKINRYAELPGCTLTIRAIYLHLR